MNKSINLASMKDNSLAWEYLLIGKQETIFLFPFWKYLEHLYINLSFFIKDISHTSDKNLRLCLSSNLSVPLLNLAKRALVWEFNLSRKKYSDLTLKTFLLAIAADEQLLIFFKKYPVLKSLLDKIISHFEVYIMQLFNRFKIDLEELTTVFELDGYQFQSFNMIGDAHCLGKRVAAISFCHQINNTVKKIIYKPRDVNLENFYNKFLQYINSKSTMLYLKSIKVVSKNNYGWLEYVCNISLDEHLAAKYYYNYGSLLAVCNILNAQDLHYENLIASGPNPIIVDLECLFSVPMKQSSNDAYSSSIFETLLLPYPRNDNKRVYDFSALLNHSNQMSFLQNFEVGGDYLSKVYIVRRNVNIEPTNNVLVNASKGKPFSATNFSVEIAAGYRYSMKWMIEHKEEIIGFITSNFSNLKGRVLFRPTFIYSKILLESYHPKLLSDFKAYHQYLSQLYTYNNELHNSICEDEIFDLLNGDIPYFSILTDDRLVKNSRGEKVVSINYCSVIEWVVNKLNIINEDYIMNVSNLIIVALKDRYV